MTFGTEVPPFVVVTLLPNTILDALETIWEANVSGDLGKGKTDERDQKSK